MQYGLKESQRRFNKSPHTSYPHEKRNFILVCCHISNCSKPSPSSRKRATSKISILYMHVSKTLQGVENSYSPLKKLAFAVVVATRRLKPYFQAHAIVVSTKYPLLQTLHKPNISGRITK